MANELTPEIIKKIKLVIWDLDETLWMGTIDNGDNVIIPEINFKFIKDFTDRGIINSICSKNDFNNAKEFLVKEGLFDFFCFSFN